MFFSTSSLKIEDLRSKPSADGEDDIVDGAKDVLRISSFGEVLSAVALEPKTNCSLSSSGLHLEWKFIGRHSTTGGGCCVGRGELASGLSHLIYVLKSKLVTAFIPLYSIAATS